MIGDGTRFADGGIYLVKILLPETVSALSIAMTNDKLNDGFGIDHVMVAHIAPIPLPPAALLLLTGIAGIAGLRRRRGFAAAGRLRPPLPGHPASFQTRGPSGALRAGRLFVRLPPLPPAGNPSHF